jgi:hypothetical protein
MRLVTLGESALFGSDGLLPKGGEPQSRAFAPAGKAALAAFARVQTCGIVPAEAWTRPHSVFTMSNSHAPMQGEQRRA